MLSIHVYHCFCKIFYSILLPDHFYNLLVSSSQMSASVKAHSIVHIVIHIAYTIECKPILWPQTKVPHFPLYVKGCEYIIRKKFYL